MYIGNTIETLSKRISKHKNDILKRPNINQTAEYFNKEHDFAKELGFSILEKGITATKKLSFKEDLPHPVII